MIHDLLTLTFSNPHKFFLPAQQKYFFDLLSSLIISFLIYYSFSNEVTTRGGNEANIKELKIPLSRRGRLAVPQLSSKISFLNLIVVLRNEINKFNSRLVQLCCTLDALDLRLFKTQDEKNT